MTFSTRSWRLASRCGTGSTPRPDGCSISPARDTVPRRRNWKLDSRKLAGRESVEPQAVDLAELTDEIVAVIEPLAAEKSLGFRVDLPPRLDPVVTDGRKVRQILVNLLGNAVKFTDAGSVEFAIDASDQRLTMRVTDTGIGIAPEALEKIFEPFLQIDHRPNSQVQGSGLGLAVARRLARLLGGDIRVTSELGRGSEFVLDLPRVQAPVPAFR